MPLARRHPIGLFLSLAFALSWILESPLLFFPDSVTGTQGFILVILAQLSRSRERQIRPETGR